jgi:parallel beta-helix repeat protein
LITARPPDEEGARPGDDAGGHGHAHRRPWQFGVGVATGFLAGTTLQSSVITQNGSSGVRLVAARGIKLGGSPIQANLISGNKLYGIFASGWCSGTTLAGNVVSNNTPGNVNTKSATGITHA